MAAQALMKKGKQTLAVYFKSEIPRPAVCQQLHDLLNHLLNPEVSIDNFERIDWCCSLIAGGVNFEDYAKIVRSYDNATTCGLVWTANFVAYRCRTCGISPCMSLCADCFHAGNHKGHDFNMFRSQAGGACDCGDLSVMDRGGFCHRHGPEAAQRRVNPPAELLAVARIMMPKLFWRFLIHIRRNSKPETLDSYMLAMNDAERFLQFLHNLSDMGAAMRDVITETLLDPDVYANNTTVSSHSETDRIQCEANYVAAMDSLKCPEFPEEFAELAEQQQRLVHKNLLDELVFWMVKLEFPQKVVTLMLSILPNERYKESFAVTFVDLYSRVTRTLVSSSDRQTISSRVVHISVQLFSNEALARRMVEHHQLLDVMLVSLDYMLKSALTDSMMQDPDLNTHSIIDCARDTMRDHCYWPIVSDLINILSHNQIAQMLVSRSRLLRLWMDLVSYFQGMNLNHRELIHHVEYEPDTYYAAFSAELEICASPMWSLLSHMKTKEHWPLYVHVSQATLAALNNWFDAINIDSKSTLVPLQVSFHLPLHRYYALFISQAMGLEMTMDSLLPSEECLKTMMKHPLQLQVSFHEIVNNMWVRNGLQIRGQAMTYIQCHFCNSMIDADIFLLQICASRLDPDYFVRTALEAFRVWDWLSLGSDTRTSGALSEEQKGQMLEGAILFFATILTFVSHMGLPEKETTRMELISLLCIADRTHSQLADLIPEKCGQSQPKDFDSTLSEISSYKKPQFEAGGSMQQGMYVPRASVWEKEFRPIHTQLRAVHRRDYQKAMDRYTDYLRQAQLFSGNNVPWPPLRPASYLHPQLVGLRRILHCRTMHGLLFTILYKMDRNFNVPESAIHYSIFLLNMAVGTSPQNIPHQVSSSSTSVRDRHFDTWFVGENTLKNIHQPIRNVSIQKNAATLQAVRTGEQVRAVDQLLSETRAATTPSAFQSLPSTSLHNVTSAMVASPVQKFSGTTETSFTKTYATEIIEIEESILTLLYKAYSRMGMDAYVPEQHRQSKSVLGGYDGKFYIGKLLDSVCRASPECMRYMEQVYQSQKRCPEKDDSKMDQNERRHRARERQKKLMEEFANKQKAFMEQAMEGDVDETVPERVYQVYDCVICGQSTPSSPDRPICLVTLAQSTSVLGHRRDTEGLYYLPTSPKSPTYHGTLCSRASSDRLQLLKQHFDERSVLMSINHGWRAGIYLQSCGHYLHLDCHKSYISSLATDEEMLRVNQVLDVNKGEYLCPFCRQLSNAIIPIHQDKGPTWPVDSTPPVATNWYQCAENIGLLLQKKMNSMDSSGLSTAMGRFMEELTSLFYVSFYENGMPSCPEGMQLFVCSIARISLELELIHAGGMLCQDTMAQPKRKEAFVPLLHVLRLHTSILNISSTTWTRISGINTSLEASSSLQLFQREVPVLLRDPVAVLFQLVLALPAHMEQALFTCIVRTLYNLMYVQALAVMSYRFTDLEREAWRQKNAQTCCESLVGLLSLVIDQLSSSGLYRDSDMDHDTLAICQSVWSPQSVELSIQEHCMHLLRLSALLKSYMFNTPIPRHANPQAEYQLLCGYLCLCEPPGGLVDPAQFQSCHALNWLPGHAQSLVEDWTSELAACVSDNGGTAKSLLLAQTSWQRPRLFSLPNEYDQIFQFYRKRTCRLCSSIPREGAVCLVCSQFLCFKEPCCRQHGKYECVQHSLECGSGTGIYLIVNSSVIIIVRGARVTLWGSVYLDEFGEEDRDLKRGRPLYLNKERYHLLERQWLDHSFDQACKKWIWHNDKL